MKYAKTAVAAMAVLLITVNASGKTLDEFKDEYEQLVYDEETQRAMLEDNYSLQEEIKEEIADLDMRLSEAQIDIDRADKDLMEILLEIDEARKNLEAAQEESRLLLEQASDRLRYIYENEETDFLDILLKCDNISDYSFYRQYTEDIMRYDAELIEELKEKEKELEEELERIEEKTEAKTALEKFKTEKEFEIAVMYEEKNRLLDEYRQNASDAEEELKELTEAADKVYDIIVNIEKNKEFVDT